MTSPLCFIEEIVWRQPDIAMPDSDETVIVCAFDLDDPVWLGYHDGERWISVDGFPLGNVTCWAHMPKGPVSL